MSEDKSMASSPIKTLLNPASIVSYVGSALLIVGGIVKWLEPAKDAIIAYLSKESGASTDLATTIYESTATDIMEGPNQVQSIFMMAALAAGVITLIISVLIAMKKIKLLAILNLIISLVAIVAVGFLASIIRQAEARFGYNPYAYGLGFYGAILGSIAIFIGSIMTFFMIKKAPKTVVASS